MRTLQKWFVTLPSVLALAGVVWGMNLARNSGLFVLKSIEVRSSDPEVQPEVQVDDEAILKLVSSSLAKPGAKTGVKTGTETGLFDIDLKKIEARILTNDWVRQVELEKKFPHTLSVQVQYRKPKAIIQLQKGALSYVDEDGTPFHPVKMGDVEDLPFLIGFANQQPAMIKDALSLLRLWNQNSVHRYSYISSIQWDAARGYRLLITYPFVQEGIDIQDVLDSLSTRRRVRAMVDLGFSIDRGLETRFDQLARVFRYLSENSIAVRQIWADAGKKIVVKTTRGS